MLLKQSRIDPGTVEKDVNKAHQLLLKSGITTKTQVNNLLSDAYMVPLSQLYQKILRRSKETPLDVIAIATYGAFLYQYGVTSKTLEQVEESLTNSSEYRRNEIRSIFESSLK